ncbi:MAG: DUF4389 domain-containing protein [Desulfuromonas sp.]|nr:MAG: DUF4389 domain-containing protein [Desulfuromonas sp.]
MEGGEDGLPTRMKILLRLLYTVLFLVVFEILRLVVQIVVVVQYVILFITRKPSEPLRGFGNKVAAYTYRLLRYITLSESVPPYPLSAFPTEPDPLEEEARFE